MGEIYMRKIFDVDRPRVGILSIGEEEGKGNELTRAAYPLVKNLPLNFVGNVEGRDLYNGNVDVIVCDGFVGNVALKISEGLVETVRHMLKESLNATISSQVGAMLSRKAFVDFKKRARLLRIRRRAAAGSERCLHYRARQLERERYQERNSSGRRVRRPQDQ